MICAVTRSVNTVQQQNASRRRIVESVWQRSPPLHRPGSPLAARAGVVGHEYFHNYTGNRVTCRDWFQLTLKEGLTVYRDQARLR